MAAETVEEEPELPSEEEPVDTIEESAPSLLWLPFPEVEPLVSEEELLPDEPVCSPGEPSAADVLLPEEEPVLSDFDALP